MARQVLIGHEGRVMGADHIPAAVGGGSPQRCRAMPGFGDVDAGKP